MAIACQYKSKAAQCNKYVYMLSLPIFVNQCSFRGHNRHKRIIKRSVYNNAPNMPSHQDRSVMHEYWLMRYPCRSFSAKVGTYQLIATREQSPAATLWGVIVVLAIRSSMGKNNPMAKHGRYATPLSRLQMCMGTKDDAINNANVMVVNQGHIEVPKPCATR